MTDLAKTETKIPTGAAAQDGLVALPETLKPSTREERRDGFSARN